MKHLKQGYNECFPTVLAMLTDTDVNKILAETRVMSPLVHSWADYTSQYSQADSEEITNVYRSLCRKYAPYLIDYCSPISVNDCIEKRLYIPYASFMSIIKASGSRRGAIISCSRFRSQPGAHIAAFGAGVVYDGNLDGPISAHDYYKKLAKDTVMCPIAVVAEY